MRLREQYETLRKDADAEASQDATWVLTGRTILGRFVKKVDPSETLIIRDGYKVSTVTRWVAVSSQSHMSTCYYWYYTVVQIRRKSVFSRRGVRFRV